MAGSHSFCIPGMGRSPITRNKRSPLQHPLRWVFSTSLKSRGCTVPTIYDFRDDDRPALMG